MPAKVHSAVRIVNKSAHLKYIGVGDGESIAVPPTAEGGPGTTVRFETQSERERFDKALATTGVQAWVEAGELEVQSTSLDSQAAASATTSPAEQVAATQRQQDVLKESTQRAPSKRESSRE